MSSKLTARNGMIDFKDVGEGRFEVILALTDE
jgi:hypothetical protein